MNNEEKAKAYDEALERARKQRDEYQKEFDKTDKDSKLASILRAAISAVEMAFPELAESEDERIREEMIRYFTEMKKGGSAALPYDDCIAYLERRKETGVQWLKSDNVKNPDKPYIDKAGMFYTTDGRMCHASEIEKQKEQKPADYEAELKKCKDNPLYFYDKHVSIKHKPAEWSDTKELVFKDICNHLKEEGYSGWVLLLNALHNGEFQPKPEWSKEDEKIVDTIVSVLGQYIDYKAVSGTGSGYATPRYSKEIDWLNSLSLNHKKKNEDVAKICSNEWSKEDEDTINLIIAILRENHPNGQFKTNPANTTCMSTISTDMLIKRIESLRPSWKPTEEQIIAVEHAYNSFPNDCPTKTNLRHLYFDLKKLT